MVEERGPVGQKSEEGRAMAPSSQGRRGLLRGSGNTLCGEDGREPTGESGCEESRNLALQIGPRVRGSPCRGKSTVQVRQARNWERWDEARGAWAGRGRGPLKMLETGHGEKKKHQRGPRNNHLFQNGRPEM